MKKMTWDSSTTKIKQNEDQCQSTVSHGKEFSFNFLVRLITVAAWRWCLSKASLGTTQHFWGSMSILQKLQTTVEVVPDGLAGTNGDDTHGSTSGGALWGLSRGMTLYSTVLK